MRDKPKKNPNIAPVASKVRSKCQRQRLVLSFETAESAIETGCKQEKQESENAPQEYELHQRIVGEQPLRAQIEPESGGNAKKKKSNGGSVMVVRNVLRCQKCCSAGVQKNG
jgi:hypothetical protein